MLLAPGQAVDWGVTGAFAIGFLTALQPCALTTNVAALALLSGWSDSRLRWLSSGFALVAGMCTLYSVLAWLLSMPGSGGTRVAASVQEFVAFFAGPLMILAGGLMTGLLPVPGRASVSWAAGWLSRMRLDCGIKAFVLGLLLAAAFCPASAGMFFAVLIPLSISRGAPEAYAAAFGAGFGLPLLAIVMVMISGVRMAERVRVVSGRIQRAAGWILVACGSWLTWRYLV